MRTAIFLGKCSEMQTHCLRWFKCLKRSKKCYIFSPSTPWLNLVLVQDQFQSSFTPASRAFIFHFLDFCVLEKDSVCMNGVRSLLNMPCFLLGYSFEARPYRLALGTASSLITIGLSIIGCSHSES